ncbi:MAG: hypothetical protein WCJ25_04535 [Candidatus Moraniibacteriota bacterium]
MFLFLISGSFSALFAVIAEIAVFSFLAPAGTGIDPWNLNTTGTPLSAILVTLVFVAVIEESLKVLVLTKQANRITGSSLSFPSLMFGFGFAVTEITMASISSGNGALIPIPAATGMLVVHGLTAFLYGSAIPAGRNQLRLMFIVGISIHLAYDIFLALA